MRLCKERTDVAPDERLGGPTLLARLGSSQHVRLCALPLSDSNLQGALGERTSLGEQRLGMEQRGERAM